ncbi:GNAT family N-acetyltransferase [Pseudonocardia sp. TMWB2A]|uniref:GNAT family N-acetyltransferase n=1 Tax=Pseudonocardia sp. TMWB2A TaxID=687430 RepID=UPI00307F2663
MDDPVGWLDHPRALASWTAVIDDAPVGQVTMSSADPDEDAARVWIAHTGEEASKLAIIVRLFVDPEHRTVGAGRMLMVAALNHAHQLGRSAALDVMVKDRKAIRLYERLGGKRLGDIVHHHGNDLTESAAVFVFSRSTC